MRRTSLSDEDTAVRMSLVTINFFVYVYAPIIATRSKVFGLSSIATCFAIYRVNLCNQFYCNIN